MSSSFPLPAAGTALRWSRAIGVAAMAWCVASAAHVLGGGHLPAVTAMIVLVVLTAWPLTFGLHTRGSGLRMVGLLGAAQVAMHAAFVGVGSWTAPTAAPVRAPMPGHHTHAQLLGSMAGQPGPAADTGHTMSIMPSPLMLFAHLVAAVLVGYVLASAERSLFSLLALLRQLSRPAVRSYRLALRVLTAILADPGLIRAALTGSRWREGPSRLPQHLLVRATGRRGPPRATTSLLPGLRA